MKPQRLIVLLFSVFCVLTVVHSTTNPPSAVPEYVSAEDATKALRAMMVPDRGEMSNLRLSHFRSVYVLAPCLSWLSMALGWGMAMRGSPNHFFIDLAYVITLVATLNYVQSDTLRIGGFELINTILFTSSTMAFIVSNQYIKREKEVAEKSKTRKHGAAVAQSIVSTARVTIRRVAQFVFMFFNVLGVTYYFTTPELFFSLQLHRMALERLTPLTNWAVLLSTLGLYFDSVFSTAFVVETLVTVAYWVLIAFKVLVYPALGQQEMSKLALWNAGFPVCLFDLLLHGAPLLFLIITRALNHDNSFRQAVFRKRNAFGVLVFLAAYCGMYYFADKATFKGPYAFVEALTRGRGAKMLEVEKLSDEDGFGMLMSGLTSAMLFLYQVIFFVFSSVRLLDLSTLAQKSNEFVIERPKHFVALNETYTAQRLAAKKEREAKEAQKQRKSTQV